MDADRPVIRAVAFPQQIADRMRQEINEGAWQLGSALPAERLLAERFRVSVGALRQGLAILVAEGLLIKNQGARTMVRGRPGPPLALPRTAADPWDQLTPTGEPDKRREAAKPRTATLLAIPEGSALYVLHQAATHATGRRVLTRRTVANRAFDGMDQADYPDPFGSRDQLISALTRYHGPLTTTEHVRPLIPDPDERDSLELAPGDLVLEAVRVTRNPNGFGLIAESERYGEGIELAYTLT